MASSAVTIVDIKDHLAAYTLLASGEFKKEIDQMETLRNELKELTAKVSTMRKLEEMQKQAEDFCAKKQAEVDASVKGFDVFKASLEREQAELLSKQRELADQVRAFNDEKNAFDTATTEMLEEFKHSKKKLLDTQSALEKTAQELSSREAAVFEKEKSLQEKLQYLASLK